LRVRPGFPEEKVICRETQYDKIPILVSPVEILERGILRSENAFAGHVDYQYRLALIPGEIYHLAVYIGHGELNRGVQGLGVGIRSSSGSSYRRDEQTQTNC